MKKAYLWISLIIIVYTILIAALFFYLGRKSVAGQNRINTSFIAPLITIRTSL